MQESGDTCFKFAGKSQKMKNVYLMADKVAQTDINILISGESGSGKETLARYIHNKSGRSGVFNSLDISLFSGFDEDDSEKEELFRHYYAKSSSGTLFINDISYASEELQELILAIFSEQEEISNNGKEPLNVRVIGATARNLRELARQRRFKHQVCDKFVMNIQIPPLRERREDISQLCEFLLERSDLCNILHKDALDLLVTYDWPGNIKELENVLVHAAIVSEGKEITLSHLPSKLKRKNASAPKATVSDELYKLSKGLLESAQHSDSMDAYEEYLKHVETPIFKAAFDMCGGNKSAAAKLLRINRNTLTKKLLEYNIE